MNTRMIKWQAIGIVINSDLLISEISSNLKKLDGIQNVISNNLNMLNIDERLSEIDTIISQSMIYKERCETALNTLDSLKPLTDYSFKFIQDNLYQINTLFKRLHLPPEFTNLRFEGEELVLQREEDNQIVHINQMSMGQKTSLALALLFQMHISGDSIPKVLLLDDPIANLDDIHIMNLVDIIRDLVVGGTQVFITTANEEIALFLSRKFMFLDEGFKYYNLSRKISNGLVGKIAINRKYEKQH